jgi:hypothetical protein
MYTLGATEIRKKLIEKSKEKKEKRNNVKNK